MAFRLPPYLYPVIAAVCWGGNFTVGRAVGPDIPAISLTFWRWVLATALLVPFVWPHLRAGLPLVRRHFRFLVGLAFLGAAVFQSFVYLGLKSTTTINAALFMSVIPLAIPLAAFLIDRQKARARLIAGILISLAGVSWVTARGDVATFTGLRVNSGDLWVLASVPVWAVYSVLLRRLPAELPPVVVLFATALFGAALLFPAYAAEAVVVGGFDLTFGNLAAIAYVAVFAALIAFATWNRGVAELGAARAGVFLHLIPVSAAVLAVLFLGERFEAYHAVGIPLVVVGLVLAARSR